MSRRQSFEVCFQIPDYEYLDSDLATIRNVVEAIFQKQYRNREPILDADSGEWSIIYIIQMPVLTSETAWKNYFVNMKKLLFITRDYKSHFCNEPEVELPNER